MKDSDVFSGKKSVKDLIQFYEGKKVDKYKDIKEQLEIALSRPNKYKGKTDYMYNLYNH